MSTNKIRTALTELPAVAEYRRTHVETDLFVNGCEVTYWVRTKLYDVTDSEGVETKGVDLARAVELCA